MLISFLSTPASAQSSIKINGSAINKLDKKKQKQGEWIYFNDSGYVVMNCFYKDDACISPMVFYKNGDTAFIKIPWQDDVQHFVLYQGSEKIYGSYIYMADSSFTQLEDNNLPRTAELMHLLNHYKNIQIPPVYYFAQQKLVDYITAGISSANLHTNTKLNVILSINAAGYVTKVDFSNNKFMLSENQERELRWMYTSMPRWQPAFYGNKNVESRMEILLSGSVRMLSGNGL